MTRFVHDRTILTGPEGVNDQAWNVCAFATPARVSADSGTVLTHPMRINTTPVVKYLIFLIFPLWWW